MKKLLVILLIALSTCSAIEESFDDVIVLEKNPLNQIKPEKRKFRIPDLQRFHIKGLNGLFNGEVGEAFRKLGEIVKKGIHWLNQNQLWDPIVNKLRELGEKSGKELCEKHLPAEVCGPAINFALNHILKINGQN